MRRTARGFTLLEVMVCAALLTTVLALVFATLSSLLRTSAATVRGATELALALRLAERFRNDVREAGSVRVAQDSASVTLTLAEGQVAYRRTEHGRLERFCGDQIQSGPRLQAVRFAAVTRDGQTLVEARWTCTAEAEMPMDDTQPLPPGGRVLVLDTLLRGGAEGAP